MTTTVTLSPEQDEIRGVARSFLEARYPSDRVRELMKTPAGFEQSDWEEIAELGWTGIAVPEEQGGAGYSVVERCLLLEEMGRVLFPCPFLSSAVLAADALALAGEGEAAAELLPGVVDGSTRATLVAGGDLGAGPGSTLRASAQGGEYELSGNGGLTLDGASAELLLAVAALEGGELALFAVDPGAEGVARNPAALIDETRKAAVLEFERAPARRLDAGGGAEPLALVRDRGAVALSAEMVGGARRAIEMTVAYMHEREQFGGPIGRFQALKHRLADLHLRIDAARQSVYAAADAIAAGDAGQVPMQAAAAKYAAATGYVSATAEAIQLHGGIGFTEEHDIGLFYKRALVSAEILGSPADQVERIAVGLDV
jgi:alkylation response protein AidB-like acyl-CoA dehydrogenase